MSRLALVAALLGVIGGSVVAVAVPHTRDAPAPHVAPQRPLAPHQIAMQLVPGTMHIELRRDDPRGGPAWAVRSFTVVRPGHSARTQQHCAQVVRILHGRFGWIDGSNVFRPAGLDYGGQAPTLCDLSLTSPNARPQLEARSLVSDITGSQPRFGTTFAWGVGGAGTERVDLRVGARRTRESASGHGAFLAFLPEPVRRSQLSATFTYAGGEKNTVALERTGPADLPMMAGLPKPKPGPVRLVARAPDPAGGLPYGLGAVRSEEGGWCLTQPQRIVGERVGAVDLDLGTFIEVYAFTTECSRPGDSRFLRRGVAESYLFGGGTVENQGASARRARVVRRTLPGTTIIAGFARADVRSITITTPRDVRTIVPTSPAHAFIAVYDGGFPTGKIVTTARFADGTSRVVDSVDGGV